MPATHVALSRALIAFLALGAVVLIQGKGREALAEVRERPWSTAILGILSFFLSLMLAMASLVYLPASVSGLLIATAPLWLSLGAVFLYRPADSRRMLLGATLALVGVGLVLFRDGSLSSFLVGGTMDIRGIGLALVNSVVVALSSVWGRRVMPGRDPIVMTALACGWGALPLLVIVALSGGFAPLLHASLQSYALLLYLGVGCTALNFTLFNHVLKRIPAERASIFQYLSPLITALLAFAFLGEPITWPLAAGGVAIIVGIALSQERRRARPKTIVADARPAEATEG